MRAWILCAAFVSAVLGQQAGTIAFEVASIKPAEPMPMGKMRIGMNVDGGMLRYSNVSLKECIRSAYRVKDFQVQGPDWLESARFDIVAKLPDGSTQDQVPEMLQNLLAERFKLALHRDSKEHAIYALVAAKGGPKLKPAEIPAGNWSRPDEAPERGAKMGHSEGPGGGRLRGGAIAMRMDPAGMHLRAASMTLANLAEAISRFCERPVVDMTGVQGQYDFDLAFSPETVRGMPGGRMMMAPPPGGGESQHSDAPSEPAASIFDAVQSYGLKLEPRKAPLEMLVIDRIEKTPTAN